MKSLIKALGLAAIVISVVVLITSLFNLWPGCKALVYSSIYDTTPSLRYCTPQVYYYN